MQTFLPYADFVQSALVLDRQRLGKQRVEAMQILNVLDKPKAPWGNHPATRMWRGHQDALGSYMNAIIEEWIRRGYKNTMKFYEVESSIIFFPQWFGNEAFHASHRSNLLRKNPEWYGQFGWTESTDMEYIWPTT